MRVVVRNDVGTCKRASLLLLCFYELLVHKTHSVLIDFWLTQQLSSLSAGIF
jgi:hypothetical protein